MDAPPPQPPPPSPRRSSGTLYAVAAAVALVLGLVNVLAAGFADCLASCERTFHDAHKAALDEHQAWLNAVIGVVLLAGGAASFARKRAAAIGVAVGGLADLSYFGVLAYQGHRTTVPFAALGLVTAAVAVAAVARDLVDAPP
jgi:hypothetical protein